MLETIHEFWKREIQTPQQCAIVVIFLFIKVMIWLSAIYLCFNIFPWISRNSLPQFTDRNTVIYNSQEWRAIPAVEVDELEKN